MIVEGYSVPNFVHIEQNIKLNQKNVENYLFITLASLIHSSKRPNYPKLKFPKSNIALRHAVHHNPAP